MVTSLSLEGYFSSLSRVFLVTRFVVGNGERIRFWEDLWWGDQPLGSQYPSLFRVVLDKNIPISSVLGPTRPFSWNLNFRRNLSDSEIEDLEGLMRSLDGVHLSPSVPDARSWPLSSSGLFSVKSFFLALSQFFGPPQVFPSKFVWNSQIPFKVQSFIWLVAHKKVNTNDMLQVRRPYKALSPDICILCMKHGESADHIFLHCSLTIGLWHRLFQLAKMDWVPPRSILDMMYIKFNGFGSSKRGIALWQAANIAFIRIVWRERNARIFEDKARNSEALWDSIVYLASLWAYCSKALEGLNIVWRLLVHVELAWLLDLHFYEFLFLFPGLENYKQMMCLDKAAVISDAEFKSGDFFNPWNLCTVTQVEELKILIRMFPIWATGIVFSAVYAQMSTMFVEQGMVMDTTVGSFTIPPASLSTFDVISVIFWVPVYDRILVPIARKFTGKERGFSELQRMGIGLFLSVLCMSAAALVEIKRLQLATALDLVDEDVAVPLSILWQIPQYFLLGAAEVFTFIGQLEFFYDQSPDAMRSLCSALSLLTTSLGNYLSAFILTVVTTLTTKDGKTGWIPDNLNKGHLDYYFWLLAGLSFLNLLVYMICAKIYKRKKGS
ncbi:Protein NRT1/ PTR family 8.3 [Vitis vinifera]|uniref:Protein NRT1/ PTR family 8.3 n=1 Tax=Vitis vinifera TaxID=29760 RepID=A0A438CWM4_VITVI|nr:Protein NRT1/ PTR family 8.3 [Vitis vinifera]